MAARAFSGAVTWVLMVVMVKLGGDRGMLYELFCKFTSSVLNMVLNYVFSKLWIFRISLNREKVTVMEREEIEQVEQELDAILKLVQPEPTIQDKAREEALSKEPASGGINDIRGIFNGRKHTGGVSFR